MGYCHVMGRSQLQSLCIEVQHRTVTEATIHLHIYDSVNGSLNFTKLKNFTDTMKRK